MFNWLLNAMVCLSAPEDIPIPGKNNFDWLPTLVIVFVVCFFALIFAYIIKVLYDNYKKNKK